MSWLEEAQEIEDRQQLARMQIEMLQEQGVFCKDLSKDQFEKLSYAKHILDELVKSCDYLLTGNYPHPGEAFHSLEIYGTYRCLYAYDEGYLLFNGLEGVKLENIPILRLYINQRLVGVNISGETVVNYYEDYLDWVRERMSGLNFSF